MSCYVSRGVGAVLINYLSQMARQYGVDLYAEFVHTDVNRAMYITYKFNGFKKVSENNGVELLKQNSEFVGIIPDYVTFDVETIFKEN